MTDVKDELRTLFLLPSLKKTHLMLTSRITEGEKCNF